LPNIATIVGARPQFIKVAPVSRAFAAAEAVNEVLIHTGQHYDAGMSDIFFDELGISKPDYHLGVRGGGHGATTGAMLIELEPLLQRLAPDWVLVYGDTNSTLAGALAAAKLHIPVAHVEAGLRSFNRTMPEEINRIVADQLSDLLFTSTDNATENLRREGVSGERVHQVGDVMYDAALQFAGVAGKRSSLLADLGLENGGYVLATIHRAENTDDPRRLAAIVAGLEEAAAQIPVLLPLHPRTRARMADCGLAFRKVRAVDPVGYLDMVALASHAALIATDSGGVQKEAFFYDVPCVTLRDETEWVELVELGWNRLVSPAEGDIAPKILAALGTRGRPESPYGDGRAAEKIAAVLAGARPGAAP
jgi:UDP-GlcNAc3NAcA epimerase